MSETVIADSPEDEVILDESVSDEARRVRVYDNDGDFVNNGTLELQRVDCSTIVTP